MIDRLVHHAEILGLKGNNYRPRDRATRTWAGERGFAGWSTTGNCTISIWGFLADPSDRPELGPRHDAPAAASAAGRNVALVSWAPYGPIASNMHVLSA
jgi:hypothetical protein